MKTKSIPFASCVAAMILSASVAVAGSHGGSGMGGFSGGGSRGGGSHSSSGPTGMTPGFARSGSRFGPGMSRNFRGDHDSHHHHHDHDFDNQFIFFGGFGGPFFYDPFYYGYYPYYYPYGYGYGFNPYNQPVYQGSVVGTGSSVREMQRRLARAGYYHGRIDGVMGPRTRYAIRAYQRSHNMRVTAR
jgi:hypothetical protein